MGKTWGRNMNRYEGWAEMMKREEEKNGKDCRGGERLRCNG